PPRRRRPSASMAPLSPRAPDGGGRSTGKIGQRRHGLHDPQLPVISQIARSPGSVAAFSLVRAGWLDVPDPIGAPRAGGGSVWRGTRRTGKVLKPPDPAS